MGYLTTTQANGMRERWKVNSNAMILGSDGRAWQRCIRRPKRRQDRNHRPERRGDLLTVRSDDQPIADTDSVKGAKNYALTNLKLAMAGKPVEEATTQPYGCHIG